MKAALVFVQGPAHFREMIRVARLLRDAPGYEPTVLFAGEYSGLEADKGRCAAEGLRIVTPVELFAEAAVPSTQSPPVRATFGAGRAVRRFRSRFLARAVALAMRPLRPLLRGLLLFIFGLVYRRWPNLLPADVRRGREIALGLDRFLERHPVALLVIPEDNFHYFTNLWIRAVHERHGAAAIVPFTIVDVQELLESFRDVPTHDADSAVNWLIAAAFPQWVREYQGRRLVMPPEHVLVNEYLRIAPPHPWLINSGAADALAVESEYMARYYRRAGIPDAQVRITGALSDDVAYAARQEAEARREALFAELGLPANRALVLCALPANQLAGQGRPTCEFATYRALFEAFLEPLEKVADAFNVVVSLHPRTRREEVEGIERASVRISSRDIAELIPLARFYVASSSATIRIAAACGIPAINYDAYRYDYADFKEVPGVIDVKTRDRYVAAVAELASGGEAYERVRRAQAEFAAREMPMDGHAGERLLALFDTLVMQRTAPA